MLCGKIKFGNDDSQIDCHLNILVVESDHKLSFERHIRKVTLKTLFKGAALQRIRHLDDSGLLTLFKTRVRTQNQAPLLWVSTYLNLLSKAQKRAGQLTTWTPQLGELLLRLHTTKRWQS